MLVVQSRAVVVAMVGIEGEDIDIEGEGIDIEAEDTDRAEVVVILVENCCRQGEVGAVVILEENCCRQAEAGAVEVVVEGCRGAVAEGRREAQVLHHLLFVGRPHHSHTPGLLEPA